MKKYLFIFLLFLVVPFRLRGIADPIANVTQFRQAQTATIALNFYKNGINLLQTELDIFGKGKERFLTLEFPLYEAIVAVFYKAFGVHDGWGRMVSVIAGIIGGWYLYKIVFLITKNKLLSFFTSFFYFFAPINMYHQKDFLIEPTIIACLLAGSYYTLAFIESKKRRHFILAFALLTLGFIQKGMYGPFWLIPVLWFYWSKKKNVKVRASQVLVIVLIPVTVLMLWQHHVNTINTANGHAYFSTSNPDHLVWNFGVLSDRLSWPLWQFRIQNLINGIFLKPGILLFIIGLFVSLRDKRSKFFYVWLVSEIVYFLLLFRIQSHINYQMILVPVISYFLAKGMIGIKVYVQKSIRWVMYILSILSFPRKRESRAILKLDHPVKPEDDKLGKNRFYKSRKVFQTVRLLACICVSILGAYFVSRSWTNSQWDAYIDWKWNSRVKQVGSVVPKDSYGIFVNPGSDWNSVYTYIPRLKLNLVSIENVSPEALTKWKDEGYSYMILHEYDKYSDYLKDIKSDYSLEFLSTYSPILVLEDFKAFIL